MPHEKPYLDSEYQKRHDAELREQWEKEARVFNVQNEAIRTVLAECPFEIRSAQDCQFCGNEACIKAWREQNKLWGLTEKEANEQSKVACLASAQESIRVRESRRSVRYQNYQEEKNSGRPGANANGLKSGSLFDERGLRLSARTPESKFLKAALTT